MDVIYFSEVGRKFISGIKICFLRYQDTKLQLCVGSSIRFSLYYLKEARSGQKLALNSEVGAKRFGGVYLLFYFVGLFLNYVFSLLPIVGFFKGTNSTVYDR